MKVLLKNATVINTFLDIEEKADILIEEDRIIGIGDYADAEADITEDIEGKYVCPGFIDGHMHIESTMLSPAELAKVSLLHGTTSVVADPHEIANVCGEDGIRYMIEAGRGLPFHIYVMLPSCVPASPFDESGAVLDAEALSTLYAEKNVIGLAEMMNYPGVIAKDADVLKKVCAAKEKGMVIDGHAPALSGKALDAYIAEGIDSDHECSNEVEAKEKIKKGQWIMIREGTAAKNLGALMPLLEEPWSRRVLFATDDRHPADLIKDGHIDNIVRKALQNGADIFTVIRVATLQAAQRFGLKRVGAVAPGYRADLLVLNDLKNIEILDVYVSGKKVVANKERIVSPKSVVRKELQDRVRNTFHLGALSEQNFYIEPKAEKCRVIHVIPGELLTEEQIETIDWANHNGIDVKRDILKLAVIERHKNTGHKGVGFISGIGIKTGAIAASVAHDSHNLIVIGTNERDMALAANCVREAGGGCAVIKDGAVLAKMPLPIAGLMSTCPAEEAVRQNEELRRALVRLEPAENIEPFMNMAFVSLPVIPDLKMTTEGLVDVKNWKRVSLYA